MEDGYYWARLKGNDFWEVIKVLNEGRSVVNFSYNALVQNDILEFGDKIEIPNKYKSENANRNLR